MKTHNTRPSGLLTRILCWFFAVWMAIPASVTAQLTLLPPSFPSSNTVRISVATGPVTNIRYDVYFTNALTTNTATWPLLATGAANQVIFDLILPDTNQAFFMVSSNHIATTNPPPKVATPVFTPPSATGNASVNVKVTCDTPGAVIYYTTNGSPPTTSDIYIANNGTILVQCMTTLKARAFRTDFVDSDIATGTFDVNCPPVVFAGNQQTTSGSSVTLAGASSDDGLIQTLSNYWRKVSGPGTVTFGDVNVTNTSATLSANGIYILQLEAFDGYWTSTSRVTVARNPAITVTLTAPGSGGTYNVPTNLALEATATMSGGSITQVQFYAGSLLIGTDTSSPWTFEWRNVPAGNHLLYAVATSTDPNHFALASSPVSITVNFPTDIGRYTFAANDLTIPVAGLPITINRSYDARFGSGNRLGYNSRLDYETVSIRAAGALGVGYEAFGAYCFRKVGSAEPYVIVQLSETEQYYFQPTFQFATGNPNCSGNSTAWDDNLKIVFTPLGTAGGTMENVNLPGNIGMFKTDDTCFILWNGADAAVGSGDEDLGCLETPYQPDWSLFTFVARDGTKYKFDSSGKLAQRIDRNTNTLTYASASITHSSGKQVQFTVVSGRITEIKDPIAIASSGPAAVKYAYDGSGRMTNVLRLVNRSGSGTYETNTYRYEDAGNPNLITRVVDARGVLVVSNAYDSFGRLTRQYDAIGNYNSFAYEDNGRTQILTDRNGASTRRELTENAALSSVQDAEGAVTSYTYDSNGRRVAEITPVGATNSVAYNQRDEVTAATNELGFSRSATYDSFGSPLTTVDNLGFGTTNSYDSKGNLAATTNAIGVVNRYGYDNQGNRTAETNAFGLSEQSVTIFQYDSFGYLTNLIDALSNKTAFTYDANGNRVTETRERTLASGTKQSLLTSNVYDAVNRPVAVVDPDGLTNWTVINAIGRIAYTTNKLGIVTRFDYDSRGLLTNTVFALGTALQAMEQIAYDAEGRRTNFLDRAGRPTSYSYDGVGRLKRTTFADGSYAESQYDVGGRIFATEQGARSLGGIQFPLPPLITRYEYDAAGRRMAVVNALNQTNRFGYDANGNNTNFVDALKRTNAFVFDRLNRPVRAIYHDQTSERFGYDALNRRFAVTNQGDIVARFGFDKLGRLVAVTNGFGSGTTQWETYAYDEVNNQTNEVDALSRMTRYEYDAMGRRTRTVLSGGSLNELFAYDAIGSVIRHTNFNGVILTNQYDALNRLTNKSSASSYAVAFSYTATGQRATMNDASGSYTYVYDNRDRLATNSGPQGTLVYVYEPYGNLQSIASTRAGGTSLTYKYDLLNRITNVVDAVAGTTVYGFDEVGNLKTVRYPNTVTNTYSYNALNRLTNLVANAAGGTLASFDYRVAAAGHRTNLIETVNGASRTNQWRYDSLHRLTNETIIGSGAITNRYDAVGNRTNRTSTVAGVTNQSFSFNTNDWLTSDVYDSNGNTRTNGSNDYAYDVENRLTNYNSGTVVYVYNGDGIRVRKTVGGTTTLYLVDDRNPTGYAQVLEEATVSGGGVTNLSKVYTYGLDLIAQREVSGGTRAFYGYDGNGNTRYLTSTNATVTDTYVYDAFGILLSSTGPTPNDYLYSGEQFDSNLGLYYLRARYLNTGTGRFWTRDPIAGNNNDPASLHKYLYVQNDPLNRVDPTGLTDAISATTSTAIYGAIGAFILASVVEVKTHAIGNILGALGGAAAEELDEFSAATQSAVAAAEAAIIANYRSLRDVISKAKDELVRLGRALRNVKVVPMPAAVIPNVANNVATAQAMGKPFLLTRTSAARARVNRRNATRGVPAAGIGFSLDEYPFASSVQGGFGARVVPVPFRENLIQGGIIAACYSIEKINVGDNYFVVVIP